MVGANPAGTETRLPAAVRCPLPGIERWTEAGRRVIDQALASIASANG
jgi:hypothetical protein